MVNNFQSHDLQYRSFGYTEFNWNQTIDQSEILTTSEANNVLFASQKLDGLIDSTSTPTNPSDKTYFLEDVGKIRKYDVTGSVESEVDSPHPFLFSVGNDAFVWDGDQVIQVDVSGSSITEARVVAIEIKNTDQDTSIGNLGTRTTAVETANTAQDVSIGDLGTRVTALETASSTAISEARIVAIETKNTDQDTSITDLGTRTTAVETKNTDQDSRLDSLETRTAAVETANTAQNTSFSNLAGRIDSVEIKNTEQDTRLTNLESASSTAITEARVVAIETKNTNQDTAISDLGTRTTVVETKNNEQDVRLTNLETRSTSIESVNTTQDTIINDLQSRTTALEVFPQVYDIQTSTPTVTTGTGKVTEFYFKDNSWKYIDESGAEQTLSTDSNANVTEARVVAIESKNTDQDTAISDLGSRTTALENAGNSQGTSITNLESRSSVIEIANLAQDASIGNLETRMSAVETKNTQQDTSIANLVTRANAIEGVNTDQDNRLTILENAAISETRIAAIETTNTAQDITIGDILLRTIAVETTNTGQDTAISDLGTRVTATETKNTEQDTRLDNLEQYPQVRDVQPTTPILTTGTGKVSDPYFKDNNWKYLDENGVEKFLVNDLSIFIHTSSVQPLLYASNQYPNNTILDLTGFGDNTKTQWFIVHVLAGEQITIGAVSYINSGTAARDYSFKIVDVGVIEQTNVLEQTTGAGGNYPEYVTGTSITIDTPVNDSGTGRPGKVYFLDASVIDTITLADPNTTMDTLNGKWRYQISMDWGVAINRNPPINIDTGAITLVNPNDLPDDGSAIVSISYSPAGFPGESTTPSFKFISSGDVTLNQVVPKYDNLADATSSNSDLVIGTGTGDLSQGLYVKIGSNYQLLT